MADEYENEEGQVTPGDNPSGDSGNTQTGNTGESQGETQGGTQGSSTEGSGGETQGEGGSDGGTQTNSQSGTIANESEYTVGGYDQNQIEAGALCVLTTTRYEDDVTDKQLGSTDKLCVNVRKENTFYTVISTGVEYKFNTKDGSAANAAARNAGYILRLAVSHKEPTTTGSVSEGVQSKTATRSAGGQVDITPGDPTTVSVESLNARDQFALNVLASLIQKSGKDPATFSKNEINFYCDTAYEWSSYLLKTSAIKRTVIESDSQSTTQSKTRAVDPNDLSSNTDILLNNLIVALEKTDYSETEEVEVQEGEQTQTAQEPQVIYSERIINPTLNSIFKEYLKHTSTGEGDTQEITTFEDYINIIKRTQELSGNDYSERVSIPALITVLNNYMKDGDDTVGLKDLIDAISHIQASSSSTVNVDTASIVTAINNISTDRSVSGTVNIGSNGLGRSASSPLYISGGGFPNKSSLAASIAGSSMDSVVAFNSSGAVGYTTKSELYNALQTSIDNRIKAWLQAAKVTVSGTDYSITINTPT